MNIGFDARFLHFGLAKSASGGNVGGIGTYQKNLIPELLRLEALHTYTLFTHRHLPLAPLQAWLRESSSQTDAAERVKFLPLEREIYLPVLDNRFGRTLRRAQAIYQHSASVNASDVQLVHLNQDQGYRWKLGRKKIVVTVYDLIGEVLNVYTTAAAQHERESIYTCWRAADAILAISEATKRDLIRRIGADANRIQVTLLDTDRTVFKPRTAAEVQTLREKLATHLPLQTPYFVHVGGIFHSKNTANIVRAFAHFKRETGSAAVFVFAGVPAKYAAAELAELHTLTESLRIEDEVKLVPPLDAHDLSRLYAGAIANVHPSLYEGFGLTLLEAMASGTAVITSNVASMPEVAGDAGMLVDPANIEDLSRAMNRMASQPEMRRALIEKGFEQIKNFSWQQCARRTLEVYQSLA